MHDLFQHRSPGCQGSGGAVFDAYRVFIAGFSVASWAPLVPYVKQRMGLDEGTLGLLLLCLGVGSILSMPLAGALAARFGCRRLLVCSTVLICLCLPLLATISSLPLLIATLFLFGASMGVWIARPTFRR